MGLVRLDFFLLDALLNEALSMLDEDNRICRAIGEHGAKLLAKHKSPQGDVNLLTHCNAGGLATVQFGTALAPIYVGKDLGLRFHVYADETRPLLQGSRITAFELQQNGVPVTGKIRDCTQIWLRLRYQEVAFI